MGREHSQDADQPVPAQDSDRTTQAPEDEPPDGMGLSSEHDQGEVQEVDSREDDELG